MIKTSTLSLLTATSQKKKQQSDIRETQDDIGFDPSDAVIARLLNYSKALSVKKSRTMGFVENLLN